MSLNVSDFQATMASHNGLQFANKYKVILPPDRFLGGLNGLELNALCSEVQLPGFDINRNVNRKAGPRQEYGLPSSYNYTEARFKFLETGDNAIQTYLEMWFELIVNEYGQINFYDKIAENITVISLDRDGNEVMETTLYECIPVTRPGIIYSNSSDNAPVEIESAFFVNHYTIKSRLD